MRKVLLAEKSDSYKQNFSTKCTASATTYALTKTSNNAPRIRYGQDLVDLQDRRVQRRTIVLTDTIERPLILFPVHHQSLCYANCTKLCAHCALQA
jgi:hypothetical protein